MDEKDEITLMVARIKVVIDEQFDGIAAALADEIEEDRSNFSRITNGLNLKGVRRVFGKLVRRGYIGSSDLDANRPGIYGMAVKSPTSDQSNDTVAEHGSPDYNVGVRVVRPNPEEDVTLPPEWAMPIIIAAAGIIFDRVDVDRARTAKEEGRKYRLRLLVEEMPEPDKQEPPGAQAK